MSENNSVIPGHGSTFDLVNSILAEGEAPAPEVVSDESTLSAEQILEQEKLEASGIKAEVNAPAAVEKEQPKTESTEEVAATTELSNDEKKAEPAKKFIAARWGEKDGEGAELPADALFEVPVDGEKQKVALQELLNNYSGKQAFDKKFSELDRERKTYIADKQAAEEQIETFISKLKTDFFDAAAYIAELSGADPIEYVSSLRETVFNQVSAVASLPEEHRAVEKIKQDNEFFKKYSKSKQEAIAKEQTQRELQHKASELREAYGISNEEIEWAEKELSDRAFAYKDFLNGEQPSQLKAIELADATRRYTTTIKALELINPELQTREGLVSQIMGELTHFRSATPEQVAEFLKSTYGIQPKSITAPRVEAEQPKSAIERKIEQQAKLSGVDKGEPKNEVAPDDDEPLSMQEFYRRYM